MTPAILDAVDQGFLDSLAAVGEHRIGGGQPHQGRFAGTKRHRQVGRQIVVDTEALGIFGDERHPDIAGEPHGHLIDRMFDPIAQSMGTARLALEILRTPNPKTRSLIDFDRLVENDGRWRIAIVECRGVDKRLERGTRLAQRLRRAIEFGLVERKTADHGEDAAGIGVHHDDRAADFRDLAQPVLPGFPSIGST